MMMQGMLGKRPDSLRHSYFVEVQMNETSQRPYVQHTFQTHWTLRATLLQATVSRYADALPSIDGIRYPRGPMLRPTKQEFFIWGSHASFSRRQPLAIDRLLDRVAILHILNPRHPPPHL